MSNNQDLESSLFQSQALGEKKRAELRCFLFQSQALFVSVTSIEKKKSSALKCFSATSGSIGRKLN